MSQVSRIPTKRRVLATVMAAMGVAPFAATALTVAIPAIQADLRMSLPLVEWLLLAYLILIAVALIPLGRLGDDYGHDRVFLGGWGTLAFGSALCALAPSGPTLIAARVVQTMGAAAIYALSPALLADVFSFGELGRALGMYGAAVGIGSALGPLIGGALVQMVGWRGLFWFVAVLAAGGTWIALPLLRVRPVADRPRLPADWTGAGWLLLALTGFLIVVSEAGQWGVLSFPIAAVAAVSVTSFWAFIAREQRVPAPLVEIRLLQQVPFAAATAAAFVSFLIWYAVLFLVPYVLQRAGGASAEAAGGVLASFTVMYAAMAPLSGWVTDRMGTRIPALAGMATATAALGWLATETLPVAPASLVAQMAVFGVGMGLFVTANNTSLMRAADERNHGMVAGVMGTARNCGMAAGVSVSSAVFGAWLSVHGETSAAMVAGFDRVMTLMAAIGTLGLAAVAAGRNPAPGRRNALPARRATHAG